MRQTKTSINCGTQTQTHTKAQKKTEDRRRKAQQLIERSIRKDVSFPPNSMFSQLLEKSVKTHRRVCTLTHMKSKRKGQIKLFYIPSDIIEFVVHWNLVGLETNGLYTIGQYCALQLVLGSRTKELPRQTRSETELSECALQQKPGCSTLSEMSDNLMQSLIGESAF